MHADDPNTEHCPICRDKKCNRHLLARFDELENRALGAGLVGGALYSTMKEIKEVLHEVRLAWIRSVRATGKPEAPGWVTKEPGLTDYFNALVSLGLNLERYGSDEKAADNSKVYPEREVWCAREKFLAGVLLSCGWLGDRTEQPFDYIPELSSTYLNWWTPHQTTTAGGRR